MIAISEDSEFHPKNAKIKFKFRVDRDWFDKESKKSIPSKSILNMALEMCPADPDDFDESTWMIIDSQDGNSLDAMEDWERSGYVAVRNEEIWVYVPARSILEEDEMALLASDYAKQLKGHYSTFITEDQALFIETKVLAALFPKYAEVLVNAFMGFAHAALLEWVEDGTDEDEEDEDFPFPK